MASLRINGIIEESIVDGEGFRFVIFTQGCPHHCEGCHNPQTHPFSGGREIDTAELYERILQNPLLKGVTFSGGEPFCQASPLAQLAQQLHETTRLDVAVYTGYTVEQLLASADPAVGDLLEQADVLIDGPFVLSKRDLTLPFRGSSNQRLLDGRQSLHQGRAVALERWK